MYEEIDYITSFPPCPDCDTILKLRNMPDYGESRWFCSGCGTQWGTPDLIEALNDNIRLANALGVSNEV